MVSVVGYRAPDGPTGAPLRNPQTGAIIGDSPFMSGLIVLVMLVFLAIEAAYGSGAKTITSMVDGINAVTKTFAGLSGLVFLRDTEVGASRANLRTALYETGCRPEAVMAAYRVADSPPNIVTPLMPYFALIVVFAQRYDKNAGVGTVVAMMLPYAVVVSVVWILLFLAWELLGLPYGPG